MLFSHGKWVGPRVHSLVYVFLALGGLAANLSEKTIIGYPDLTTKKKIYVAYAVHALCLASYVTRRQQIYRK